MDFVNGLKWVQKWIDSGFSGAKVGENGSKPSCLPTLDPSWDIDKKPMFLPTLKGVELVFQQGP